MKENVIGLSVRLNVKKQRDAEIVKVLNNLDHAVYRSKNEFILQAIEFYIDHYGDADLAVRDEKNILSKADMLELLSNAEKRIQSNVNQHTMEWIGGLVRGMMGGNPERVFQDKGSLAPKEEVTMNPYLENILSGEDF